MNKSLNSTGLYWLRITLLIIIIDFISKLLIFNNFALEEVVPLCPLLNLYYVRNYGAAFSFLSEMDGWQHWLFASVTIFTCAILLLIMYRSKPSQKLNNIAYSMIIGGAIGNLIDRILYGFVIDMIDFYINNWHFATFNLADSSICIGTSLILLDSLKMKIAKK